MQKYYPFVAYLETVFEFAFRRCTECNVIRVSQCKMLEDCIL